MALEADVRTFLSYLRVEKGLSDNTIQSYRRDMLKFVGFLEKQNLDTAKIQRQDVVDFLAMLYKRRLDSRSVARHLVTIRHFFRFSLLEGFIKEDPAATIESPKFRQSLPYFLSVEEVERLLKQPDISSLIGLRDKAIIELMYSTGIRVSELAGIRVGDLQLDAGCLRCIGKGNKERLVPVGKKALAVVEAYLKKSRPELLRDNRQRICSESTRTRDGPHNDLEDDGPVRKEGGVAEAVEAAHAAAQFCDAFAGSGSRSSIGTDDAGAFGYFNDADLHARGGRKIEAGLQGASPAGLKTASRGNRGKA